MNIVPTDEQQDMLDESSNCVVVARPGSGKTLTISYKIAAILPDLPHYKGGIAISYTNKASDELKRRCLSYGVEKKGSFFGTIDKFFLSEIIIPFGGHIFLPPQAEFDVIELQEVQEIENPEHLQSLLDSGAYQDLVKHYISVFAELYTRGQVLLEAFGFLALYIFNCSLACRRYLKARYSHVFIDEYQDCDIWQHILFSKLVDLSLCGIAVGDLNQSIFAFAKKDPKYLAALARDSNRFAVYPLSENHRCHPSIINYSLRLLSSRSRLLATEEIQVYEKRVEGSEIEIAHWLSEAVPRFSEHFGIQDLSKIGILFRGRRTGNLIHRNLEIPHKPVITTPLDRETSLWGNLFRKILILVFSNELTKYELVEDYLSVDVHHTQVKKVLKLLREIEGFASIDLLQLQGKIALFVSVAEAILPRGVNRRAVIILKDVLASKTYLESYIPPRSDQVQVMTLYKAKGLEFDMVFHLDLYKYIVPRYKCSADEYVQYLNLHYVGITRAKQACVFCLSSARHNPQLNQVNAEDSEFLHMNDLEMLRVHSPF